ncbi:hypothetical protein DVH24_039890 [Malus domestica]|uniref:Short-chain dehydrogenase/reductase n=1 Tax=Malus domestica TaxID=3750 RepID=A0A498I4U7_MALDO|nr:hypothetical protein DVH24_039890 [Malus domestica]
MEKSERAKERKEKRLQEISLLRTIPYSDHQRWWSAETVAVVTGGNRGIGFEISKQLAAQGVTVILTSRDHSVGLEAAKVFQEGGFNVFCHQLDVLDTASITEFCDWLKQNYGGLDILINNAAVNFNQGFDNTVEYASQVITTNYYGTKNMIQAMIPLMKPSAAGARIVNVSSRLGRINGKRSVRGIIVRPGYAAGLRNSVEKPWKIEDVCLREKFSNLDTITEELIDQTVSSFLQQVQDGTWESGGWPKTFTDYSVSKLAVNTYTRLMAKMLSDRPEGQKIYINCYCPGWVKTAMTGYAGNISVEAGADTAVWLALLPDLAVTGKFFAERREISF